MKKELKVRKIAVQNVTGEAGGGEGLVMQDLKGLTEDIHLSETPEENMQAGTGPGAIAAPACR